jgi:hypothetical protein
LEDDSLQLEQLRTSEMEDAARLGNTCRVLMTLDGTNSIQS